MAGGGERETVKERETDGETVSGWEDKPVWQVCVTVHNSSCKVHVKSGRQKQRERSWELMSLRSAAFIMNLCQHNGPAQVVKLRGGKIHTELDYWGYLYLYDEVSVCILGFFFSLLSIKLEFIVNCTESPRLPRWEALWPSRTGVSVNWHSNSPALESTRQTPSVTYAVAWIQLNASYNYKCIANIVHLHCCICTVNQLLLYLGLMPLIMIGS